VVLVVSNAITHIDPTGWMVIHPKQIAQVEHYEVVDGEPLSRWSSHAFNLHGFNHPSIFGLFRNARKQQQASVAQRLGGVITSDPRYRELSKILWFDARYLPQIHEDEIMQMEKIASEHGWDTWRPKFPGLPDRLSELEFAERQVQQWGLRAEELRKAAGL
jgi:hypothetical protein